MGLTLTVKGKKQSDVCEICACANELFDFSPESGQSFVEKSEKGVLTIRSPYLPTSSAECRKPWLLLFRLPEDGAPCHRHVTAIKISNAENIGPMIMIFNCQSVANLAASSASAQIMYTCNHLHSDKILRWNAAIQLHNAHHRQPGPDFFFGVAAWAVSMTAQVLRPHKKRRTIRRSSTSHFHVIDECLSARHSDSCLRH